MAGHYPEMLMFLSW